MAWLYCGDNLRILNEELQPESIDLVYLDPPFNSQEDYGVIYREADGRKAAAQVQVFEDTWRWNPTSSVLYDQVVLAGGLVGRAVQAFRGLLGESDMMAYLAMMAPRLMALHRVLKPTGSLYLHCDPAASHYLKILLDAIFGGRHFLNEVVWKRTSAHGDASRRFAAVHDTILSYAKTKDAKWNKQYAPYSEEYIREHFVHLDPDGRRFRRVDLRSPNPRPNLTYDYRASNGRLYKPHRNGWAVSLTLMRQLDAEGRLFFPAKENGRLRRKIYLDESPGVLVSDVWIDLPPIHASSQERLGYPTQKPKALLERIIAASTDEGDVVLDPFCGCGTTIDAAQGMNRQWIGIDVTHLAISVIRSRLRNEYPDQDLGIELKSLPATEDEARRLAQQDAFQFQCWILGECGINPLYQKRGADRGVDGRLFFFEGGSTSPTPAQIVFSVKSGKVGPAYVRELAGVVRREGAQIGVLVTLEPPTAAMLKEAAAAAPFHGRDGSVHAGLQILTVSQILEGFRVAHPAGRSLSLPDAKMAKAAAVAAAVQQQTLKFG